MKIRQISRYNLKMFMIASLIIIMCFQNIAMTVHATNDVGDMEGAGNITTDSLNVRSGPGKDYDSIGKVYSSDTIKITGSSNDWYRIDYNGSEGYVSAGYVTLQESEKEEVSSSQPQAPTTEAEDDEVTGFEISNYKIPIIGGSIVLLFIIIFITLRGIRKLDDDDDEDDDEDDDDEDDDEYDDEEEDDEYEDEIRASRRRKSSKSKKANSHYRKQEYYDDDDFEEDDEPFIARSEAKRHQDMINLKDQEIRKPKPQPMSQSRSMSRGKELDMILSNNPDDYRIDIDPIFFEDDRKREPLRQPNSSTQDDDLKKAMKKMEELQREIERIKNQK